ncbi:MAG: hypothetical protein AMXMBFR8_23980 [Nevskiales bacterium]
MTIVLGACGLKGDLYLPEPPAAKPQPTSVTPPAGDPKRDQDEQARPTQGPAEAP